MESSKKLIESSFPVIGVDFESSCNSTSAPIVLGATEAVCAEEIIPTAHLAAELEVCFCHCSLSRVPISLVTPILCISPITSSAPAVSQLMTYGKTALSNSFSKSFVQYGIYCSDWPELEFVCTFLCKMRLEVNILTCWGSAKWKYTGHKGLSVYTPVRYSGKGKTSLVWNKKCSWFLKFKKGRIFMTALPGQNKEKLTQHDKKKYPATFWAFGDLLPRSACKCCRSCTSFMNAETAMTPCCSDASSGSDVSAYVCVQNNSDFHYTFDSTPFSSSETPKKNLESGKWKKKCLTKQQKAFHLKGAGQIMDLAC